MTAIATAHARPARALTRPRAALLLLAASFALASIVWLLGHPHTQHRLTKPADYLMTALLLPITCATLLVLTELRLLQKGRDGRLGMLAVQIAGLGLTGFAAAAATTLATGTSDSQGPLYPLAMAVSLLGFILFAVASVRARILPRWLSPALAVGWLVGGPAAPTAVTMLVFAAVLVVATAKLTVGEQSSPSTPDR